MSEISDKIFDWEISDSNFMYIFVIVRNFSHVLWLIFKFFETVTIFQKHTVQNDYLLNWPES